MRIREGPRDRHISAGLPSLFKDASDTAIMSDSDVHN